MGEEVRMTEYQTTANGVGAEHEERVIEWEMGLPAADDLTPLSQPLIPPELASAFSISMEPCRTLLDVTRASQTTLSNLHLNNLSSTAGNNFKSFTAAAAGANNSNDPMVVEEEEEGEEEEEVEDEDNSPGADQCGSGSDTRNNKLRKIDSEETDSAARTLKRPRLVWTPQLHKRFVDVVAHLGIKSAVPKTIMQLMNVEGLTRENVASHLQKYRLYLKRMQGFSSSEGGAGAGPPAAATSSSDHQLFASTPVPQSLNESNGNGSGNGNTGMTIQTMAYHHHHHHPMGMQMYGNVGMHNHQSYHQYQNGFDHGNFNYGNGYGSGGAFQHHNHHHHHHHPHHVGSNDNNVM